MQVVQQFRLMLRRAGPALAASLLLSAPIAAWEVSYDGDGIRVSERPYPGSAVQEFRGERRLSARLGEVMALLRDADYNASWVYRSGGARVIASSGPRQAYVYGVVDAPWPIDDRDTVVRFDYRQDPQTAIIRIDITNMPDYLPLQPGRVRVPDFGGFWELAPLPGGEVAVTYQVRGTPGGLVPVWLANQAARLSVRRTLQNMAAAVERYRGRGDALVREPPATESGPIR